VLDLPAHHGHLGQTGRSMPLMRVGARVGPVDRIGVVSAALFLALFCGVASVFLPAWFVVSVLLVPSVLVVLLVRPEYALVIFIGLVCDLVHPALVPRVPFLGGSLAAGDATLLMLVMYGLWTGASQAGTKQGAAVASASPVPGWRLLVTSVVLFSACLLLSVVLSLSVWGLSATVVLGETRDLLYLAALPIALVVLRQPARQQRFVVGLVVLGCLFSIGQVLQGLFNLPVFGTAGISALETLGYREYSTTRSNTHGLSIIIFSLFLVLGAYVLGTARKALLIPVLGLLAMGILLTFGRTTFAAVLLCVIVLVAWLDVKRLPRLLSLLLLFVVLVSALGLMFKPASFEAVLYRMTSIESELRYGYSAGWRFMEVDAMLPHILSYPLTGIGLGADYKGLSGSSAYPDLNRYMHNAYLYMAGKMGLPALALFLTMMGSIFAIGRRSARNGASPWVRIVGAASAVMMIRFVISSVTEPHLMSDHGVLTIGIAGALACLAVWRMRDEPPRASSSGGSDELAGLGPTSRRR
jgi:O-antigen ligase